MRVLWKCALPLTTVDRCMDHLFAAIQTRSEAFMVACFTATPFQRTGIVLAYSNRFAGQLSDLTVQRGMGNVGCFYGGGAAALAAAFLIILFWKFGSLGQDPLEVEKRKGAQA